MELFAHRERFNNISKTSSEGLCARLIIKGQVDQRRVWPRDFCEKNLEANFVPIRIKQQNWVWDPRPLGECYPKLKYAINPSYSGVEPPVCDCLSNCKQDLPVCCHVGEQKCRPCPQPDLMER
eukprot:g31614.t1